MPLSSFVCLYYNMSGNSVLTIKVPIMHISACSGLAAGGCFFGFGPVQGLDFRVPLHCFFFDVFSFWRFLNPKDFGAG